MPRKIIKKRWVVEISSFKDGFGNWAKVRQIGRVLFVSKSYSSWKRIIQRGRDGSAIQKVNTNYVGCSIHDDFLDFQKFANWHTQQIGYNIAGYAIDKDILVVGNKEYGPETCILVPPVLNSFFVLAPTKELPRGVRADPAGGGYRAEIKSRNRQTTIGRFSTVEKAHEAYRKVKQEEALKWVERIESGEVIVDKRIIPALNNWSLR